MSSVEVERRLTEVLQRHAEDAMNRTDTQQQLREFFDRDDHRAAPVPSRRRLLLAGAAAAAAVAGVALWGTGLTEDNTQPAPVQEPVPMSVQVAEEFVAAYAANDTETVAELADPLADVDGWHRAMGRNDAWGVQFLFEGCVEQFTWSSGTEVTCPFSLHALHSKELGLGPFENALLTVLVTEKGKVLDGDPTWNHEGNGLMEHVDAVYEWVEKKHPQQMAFLELDEPQVPAAEWDRWLALWERYAQEYLDAHS